MNRIRLLAVLLYPALASMQAQADPLKSSYSTGDGRAGTVIIACPSQDGTFSAAPCSIAQPGAVTYSSPAAAAITAANSPITVFAPGSIATGL